MATTAATSALQCAALPQVTSSGRSPGCGGGVGSVMGCSSVGVRGTLLGGDEVDELFDATEEGRGEVVERGDLAEGVPPGPGDVGLVAVGPAEPLADALLPLLLARHVRPPLDPEPGRLDRGPDVDEGVADDQHVLADRRARHGLGDPALLGAPDEVVDEHADAALRPR